MKPSAKSEIKKHGIREIARLAADKAFPCTCGDDYVAATLSHRHECPILPEAQFQKVWIACEKAAKAVVEECAKAVEETPFAYGTLVGKRQRDLKQRAARTIRALATSEEPNE